jgi:hypothetical protein
MRLANPTPMRLTHDQLIWLDQWRGNRMSRCTAIRVLIDQAIRNDQQKSA